MNTETQEPVTEEFNPFQDVINFFNLTNCLREANKNQTSKPIVHNWEEVKNAFAKCGHDMTDTDAKKYYNAVKFSYQEPVKLTGFGSEEYNKMYEDTYKNTIMRIQQLKDIICNKKENLLALKKEFFGTDQSNYERLDNFINQINHINEKDSDFEDKILQCLVTINEVDLSFVYALLSLHVVSLNEISRKRADIQNSDMPYREAVSALADLDAQEKLFLYELNELHTGISDEDDTEENDDCEEYTIFDSIADKVSDLICVPFNWMTEKMMNLTFN